MRWSETAQRTLAWHDSGWRTLSDVPPGAEGLPYREWLLQPAYEAANRRRNEAGTRQDPPMASQGTRNAAEKSGRLPGHEERGVEGF